jgi:HK97 family phage major capsid protein
MATKAQRVLDAVQGTVWAIDRDKLEAIGSVVARRFTGQPKPSDAEIAAIQRDRVPITRAGVVAVLPLQGVIAQHMDMMTAFSGGTSTEQFARSFNELVADDSVAAIVIDCNSPGGSVAGVPELAAMIRAARGSKPIVAVANSLMCSAAYWIASAADKIVATRLSFVASCNAIMVRCDVSDADAADGVKYFFVTGGNTDNKAEGSPHFPVSDGELEHLQAQVDVAFDLFMSDVAANRGISTEDAKKMYGQGRAFIAPNALDAGIVDEIDTLENVIAGLLPGGAKTSGRTRADADVIKMAAVTRTKPILAAGVSFDEVAAGNSAELRYLMAAEDTGEIPEEEVCPECGAPMEDGHCTECDYETPTESDDAGADASTNRISLHATQPAPKAKEHTVKEDTAAQTGAAEQIAAERKRASELAALQANHPTHVPAATLSAWLSDGTTIDAARAFVLDAQTKTRDSATTISVGTDREATEPMAFGEMLQAVALAGGADIPGVDRANLTKRLHSLHAAATGHSATVGSDGGFRVGLDTSADLMQKAYEYAQLASRCSTTEIGANSDGLESQFIKESSRATGSRLGGVRVYRGAEADSVTASKMQFGRFELRLEDMLAATYFTERSLQDASSLASVVSDGFRDEFAFVLDDEIVRGTGAGQCLGVTIAPATVSVTKETGQTAATLVAENVMKMWARCWGRSRLNSVWFYNQELEPQFQSMQIGTGTSAQLVYMPPGGLSNAQYGTLYGRPCIPIEQASAPGTVGDIMLLDLSQYKLITKGGLQNAESIHVRFLNNERCFRFTTRVNGKPTWDTALTPYKGSASATLSPFVVLGAR